MPRTPDETALSFDDDPSNQLNRPLADVHQALRLMEQRLLEMRKLVDVADDIRRVFQDVGQRLVDVTCRAGLETTHGKSPQDLAIALVTELAELAAAAVKGSGQLHREVDNARASIGGMGPVLQDLLGALEETSRVVAALGARSRATPVCPPSVIIDTRALNGASAATRSTDDARRLFGPPFGARGTRFSN